MTAVSGASNQYDITSAEGTVYTAGTLLNATNLNKLTQLDSTVETAFTSDGMTAGTYNNEVSDALMYLLNNLKAQTSGAWTYLEIGGIFIGMYSGTQTAAITEAVGSSYQSSSSYSITYPKTLTSVRFMSVSMVAGSYAVWTQIRSLSTTALSYRPLSTGSRTSTSYAVRALVIGTV